MVQFPKSSLGGRYFSQLNAVFLALCCLSHPLLSANIPQALILERNTSFNTKEIKIRYLNYFQQYRSYNDSLFLIPQGPEFFKRTKYINTLTHYSSKERNARTDPYLLKRFCTKGIRDLEVRDFLPNLSHATKLKKLRIVFSSFPENRYIPTPSLASLKKLSALKNFLLDSLVPLDYRNPLKKILDKLSRSSITQTSLSFSNNPAEIFQRVVQLKKILSLKILNLRIHNLGAQNLYEENFFPGNAAEQLLPLAIHLDKAYLFTDMDFINDSQIYHAKSISGPITLSVAGWKHLAEGFYEKFALKEIHIVFSEKDLSPLLNHAETLEILRMHFQACPMSDPWVTFLHSFLPKCTKLKDLYLNTRYVSIGRAQNNTLKKLLRTCDFKNLTKFHCKLEARQLWLGEFLRNPSLENLQHLTVSLEGKTSYQLITSQSLFQTSLPALKSIVWDGFLDFSSVPKIGEAQSKVSHALVPSTLLE